MRVSKTQIYECHKRVKKALKEVEAELKVFFDKIKREEYDYDFVPPLEELTDESNALRNLMVEYHFYHQYGDDYQGGE